MTRDEILNMPAGPALNALIATEVMGWDIHPVSPDPYERELAWYSDDGNFQCGDEHWKPSENIADAWQVVEKMRENNIVSINNGWVNEDLEIQDDVLCSIWPIDFDAGEFEKLGEPVEIHHKSAPLAISRAALLAVLT